MDLYGPAEAAGAVQDRPHTNVPQRGGTLPSKKVSTDASLALLLSFMVTSMPALASQRQSTTFAGAVVRSELARPMRSCTGFRLGSGSLLTVSHVEALAPVHTLTHLPAKGECVRSTTLARRSFYDFNTISKASMPSLQQSSLHSQQKPARIYSVLLWRTRKAEKQICTHLCAGFRGKDLARCSGQCASDLLRSVSLGARVR